MKINKQVIFLGFILIISIVAYNLIPNFEREQFNPDLVEEISSGTITTTTINTEENDIVKEDGDISEDEETFLYESYNNIYKVNSSTIDTLELQTPFYYARFTQIENEIIYYKPTIGLWGKDKIYKYSFSDNETTLLADSLYRFANPHSIIMSPSKDKFAYFKSDFSNSGYYQLYVVDIQSGQETFLDSIQNSVNIWMPPNYYWATDGFLYLNIANNNGLHLYKIHSSDTEMPLEQVTEGNIYLRLLGSHSTHLDKLLLTSFSDSVVSNLYVYELENGQLSYIDSIQGEYPTTQTWAKDNSKVAIGSQLSLWESYTSIQVYDFTNDTIIVLSDSAEPLFWLGGQELDIRSNLGVSIEFPATATILAFCFC